MQSPFQFLPKNNSTDSVTIKPSQLRRSSINSIETSNKNTNTLENESTTVKPSQIRRSSINSIETSNKNSNSSPKPSDTNRFSNSNGNGSDSNRSNNSPVKPPPPPPKRSSVDGSISPPPLSPKPPPKPIKSIDLREDNQIDTQVNNSINNRVSKPNKPIKPIRDSTTNSFDITHQTNNLSINSSNSSSISPKRSNPINTSYNNITNNTNPSTISPTKPKPLFEKAVVPNNITISTSNNNINVNENKDKDKEEDIGTIRQGILHKTNRDGKEDIYLFTLTSTTLSYIEPTLQSNPRILPLNSLIVKEVDSSIYPEIDTTTTFSLLSKQKSFFLRADVPKEKKDWFHAIDVCSTEIQNSTNGKVLKAEECATLLVGKSKVSECQLCAAPFGIFSRRHHCRNCGKCVCESCSREKVRIERIDEKALFKVCSDCAREIKNNRKYGATITKSSTT